MTIKLTIKGDSCKGASHSKAISYFFMHDQKLNQELVDSFKVTTTPRGVYYRVGKIIQNIAVKNHADETSSQINGDNNASSLSSEIGNYFRGERSFDFSQEEQVCFSGMTAYDEKTESFIELS